MSMSPFSLTVLGIEAPHRLAQVEIRDSDHTTHAHSQPSMQRPRPAKRTQYASTVQTSCTISNDSPPSYDQARKQRRATRRPEEGAERLPGYSCSVTAEAKVLINVESISPLHLVMESDWREVYMVLRGTMLSFHRIKDGAAGKLLRSYTLQHAEVGLATDSEHTVLTPKTRLARLIPVAARRKAHQKDPDLFDSEKQTIMRLRLETDQILVASSSEDQIHALIFAMCSAIDIALPLDERSLPKQTTMPRRRRRVRTDFTGDLNDPALLREQERILRERYPDLARSGSQRALGTRPELRRNDTTESHSDTPLASPRDEDELDLSMIREATAETSSALPAFEVTTIGAGRQASAAGMHMVSGMIHASPASNFTADAKWSPTPTVRSEGYTQRFIRRCLPVLLAESPRASDILICNSKRVRINWRMELLEPWELKPPSYKLHQPAASLARSASSGSSSTPPRAAPSSRSVLTDDNNDDRITPADVATTVGDLELTKTTSGTSVSKASSDKTAFARPQKQQQQQQQNLGRKMCEPRSLTTEVSGLVFCF